MADVEWIPILSDMEGFGLCKEDLSQTGTKKDNWLGVKYKNKTVSGQVREVSKNPSWPDHLIWIEKSLAKDLKLYDQISGSNPDDSPPKSYALTVHKELFTHSKMLLPAILTTVFAVAYAVLTVFVQLGILSEYKTALVVGILVLAILTALMSGYAVYVQKQ